MFKYFFVLIFLFLVLFNALTRDYVNPYKFIMVFGKKGSGKTTFLTKIAQKNIRKGRIVYSTVPIPGTRLFNARDIGHVSFEPESILLIDEVSLIWDNRSYKSFDMDVAKAFRLQRHDRLTIYAFSQTFDIDKKLRDLCDSMYLLRCRMRVWSVARKINKRVTISSNKGENGEDKASSLVEDYKFASLLESGGILVTFIPRWVMFFDTRELRSKLVPVNSDQILYTAEQAKALSKKGYLRYLANKFVKRVKAFPLSVRRKKKEKKEINFFDIDRGKDE